MKIVFAIVLVFIAGSTSAQTDTAHGSINGNLNRSTNLQTSPNGTYLNHVNTGNTRPNNTYLPGQGTYNAPNSMDNNRVNIYNTTTKPFGAVNQNGTRNTNTNANENTPPYNNGTNGTGSNSSNVINSNK